MFGRHSYNVAPDIIDAGQGGGSGNIVNNSLPLGVVVPFAGIVGFNGGSGVPEKWELCDGRQLRTDTYADLFNMVGFTYGIAPSTQVQTGIGNYSYNSNTLTFSLSSPNVFMQVGGVVRPAGFTTISGEDLNGTYVLITATPNIGAVGVATGTFIQPVAGVGNGNLFGSGFSMNRASFSTPNLVSRFPLGASTTTTPSNASTGGSATTTLTITNLPPHSHTLWRGGAQANQGSTNADWIGSPNVDTGLATGGNIYRATDTPATGTRVQQVGQDGTGQTAFSTLNPYLALNYIIHAKL